MADQQELIILLQAQLGDTLGQLKAVQNQVTSMGSAAQGAAAPVTKLGSTFSAVLGGVAVTALTMLSRKMMQFGKDAVDAFTKSDAAAKEFANTLEQRGLSQVNAQLAVGAVEQMAVPAGFDPEEIQQAMSNVIVKMHNGANATSAFESAMNNARIKGISLATSVQSVTIAAEGSLKALRQFGITTNKDVNGNLKTEAQLLKEIAENTKGGLTTYMSTPLGMIDRMKVSLQQLKEAIGQGLTSVFAPVASATFGFSSALVAALVRSQGGQRITDQMLTNPSGFAGIDGVFRFKADGTNERGLAVMRVAAGGGQIISPAPKSFGAHSTSSEPSSCVCTSSAPASIAVSINVVSSVPGANKN